MQALILIGHRTGKNGKEVVNLYTGLSGSDLEAAAAKAAKEGGYYLIGKIVNPSCTPMPVDPTPTRGTVPTFPRSKAVEVPNPKRNALDKIQDRTREQREARLKTTPPILSESARVTTTDAQKEAVKASEAHAEAMQVQKTKHPGGSSVDLTPTISFEEFVANGGGPAQYPPSGFRSVESDGWKLFREGDKTETSKVEAPAAAPMAVETSAAETKK